MTDQQPTFESKAYVVDRPWADADYVIIGHDDPHIGRLLCDCSRIDEEADIEEGDDWPYTAQDAAAEIAHRWNEWAEMREALRGLTRMLVEVRHSGRMTQAVQVLASIAAREEIAKAEADDD